MKLMKILKLEPSNVDEMWDQIKGSFRGADSHFDEMMYDLDDGDELKPVKRKALTESLNQLEHKIRVFRSETDV